MSKNIKEWNEEERPREKMLLKGCNSLSSAELIAILIHSGSSDCTAVDTARDLLETSDNSLGNLSKMSCEQLTSIRGIGKAKAATLMAAVELGKRMAAERTGQPITINSSGSVARMMAPFLKDLDHEELWIIYLNKANKLIGKEMISRGGISSTIVDIRIIVKKCIEKMASSVILLHNHPSGSPRPGGMDYTQTKAVKEALSVVDIALADHIIIAGNKYFSFFDESIH